MPFGVWGGGEWVRPGTDLPSCTFGTSTYSPPPCQPRIEAHFIVGGNGVAVAGLLTLKFALPCHFAKSRKNTRPLQDYVHVHECGQHRPQFVSITQQPKLVNCDRPRNLALLPDMYRCHCYAWLLLFLLDGWHPLLQSGVLQVCLPFL